MGEDSHAPHKMHESFLGEKGKEDLKQAISEHAQQASTNDVDDFDENSSDDECLLEDSTSLNIE